MKKILLLLLFVFVSCSKDNFAWHSLHSASCFDRDFTLELIDHYLNGGTLCSKCKVYFKEYHDFSSAYEADDLFQWTIDAHNYVNVGIGKDKFITRKEADDLYLL